MCLAIISWLGIQQHCWCRKSSLLDRELGRSKVLSIDQEPGGKISQVPRHYLLATPAHGPAGICIVRSQPANLSCIPCLFDLGLTTSLISSGVVPLLPVCICFPLFLPGPHLFTLVSDPGLVACHSLPPLSEAGCSQ